jgi:hypothetical protein
MDFNEYALECDVRDRLANARAAAARRALVPARSGRDRRLVVALGTWLIAVGQWLAAPAPAARERRA